MTLLACGSRQALTAVTADLEHRRRWVLINTAVASNPWWTVAKHCAIYRDEYACRTSNPFPLGRRSLRSYTC